MVPLFTCMKAHTPVMYTGSEQSWNGEKSWWAICYAHFKISQSWKQSKKQKLSTDFFKPKEKSVPEKSE